MINIESKTDQDKVDYLICIVIKAYDDAITHQFKNPYFYGYNKSGTNRVEIGIDRYMWERISKEDIDFINENFEFVFPEYGCHTLFKLKKC